MENKVDRKRLIKGGAGGALALGLLGAGAAPASAGNDDDDDDGLSIHVHGVLTGIPGGGAPGVNLAVNLDVAGTRNNLAGAGWDSGTGTSTTSMKPVGNLPTGPVGACYYTANGSVSGHTLTLVGTSLFTNRGANQEETPAKSDTRADGRDLNATVNLRTGAITWSLSPGGAVFAGTALVLVNDEGDVRP